MSKKKFLEQNQRPGEIYAGLILGKNGEADYHLFLLPGEAAPATWKKQLAWAKKQGGELPTRREQSLLIANLKEEFKPEWYWSAEQHAAISTFAWAQTFVNGSQLNFTLILEFRARAVRRVPIQ